MKSETKNCQNYKNDFTIEPDDFSFYEKIKVPAPTFCPDCRLQRRMTFRNERTLYKRSCGICKGKIISLYPEETSFDVYCNHCWYGDKWDSTLYGQDYDFSKSFFEQFKELMKRVPRPALIGDSNVNSPYVNYSANLRNCYLVNCSDTCENSGYCDRTFHSKESFDCFGVVDSELCYESNQCIKSYKVSFVNNSENSIDSVGIKDCKNISECLFCINLRNKSNFLLNEKITKKEFDEQRKKIGSYAKLEKFIEDFKQLSLKVPNRFANNIICLNSDGNELYGAKNCHDSFFVRDSENLKYAYFCSKIKDSHDFNFADNSELVYESSNIEQNYLKLFSTTCWYSNNVTYSDLCISCSDVFGCVGLRNKKYCILNKTYSKEEYIQLKSKIIEEMSKLEYKDKNGNIYKYGEFFPPEISPFAHNETIAQNYFSLSKEQALLQGYKWKDKEERNYQIDIKNEDIPDNIKDINDDIIGKVIECGHKGTCNQQCTEAFKIIPEELQFYHRMNLPLPRLCPNCRHYERLSQRNPLKLWHRTCMKEGCNNEFETSYSPERPEIIYCESCYQKEVY
jgi:hypothetical protein